MKDERILNNKIILPHIQQISQLVLMAKKNWWVSCIWDDSEWIIPKRKTKEKRESKISICFNFCYHNKIEWTEPSKTRGLSWKNFWFSFLKKFLPDL